jgi:hypothetical protein
MILHRGYDGDGNMIADVSVSPVAGLTDGFDVMNGTRPLTQGWTSIEWIVRPAFGHPTLLISPAPSTANGGIVPDGDVGVAAEFSFNIAPATFAAIALPSDQASQARYHQLLRAIYPDATDYTEIWRGALIIRQGRAP